ncbi:substrate-binding domain-containing protein, partial [Adlercreutzia sp. DFI.6.23]|uniref:substrate-binding domain-containing protein n=1 Tax=Adlercreutzia sp. DFI.6.23 TaxID=2963705 RepID=UPI00210D034D
MEKLAEAFQAANPQVTVEVQQSDSTTGVNMAVDGTCDIGMASRELKDSTAAEDQRLAAYQGEGHPLRVRLPGGLPSGRRV